MAGELKWIKLNLQMFDDEKIKLIEAMPESDAILLIWIKLLIQAGKSNASGYLLLNDQIAYDEETLSIIFNKPIMVVRLALQTFERFGMITTDNRGIFIENWEKHQNVEGMEKIREQNRLRKQKQRGRLGNVEQPTLLLEGVETESDTDSLPYKEIIDYLNDQTNKTYKHTTKKTKTLIHARWNEGFRLDDFKRVIDNKVTAWRGGEMERYLRPETLFGTKFEGYLNETPTQRQTRTERNQSELEAFMQQFGGENQ